MLIRFYIQDLNTSTNNRKVGDKMNQLFSDRILHTKKSFIREILKVTQNKEIISFAGGLPNPISFPILALKEATNKVFDDQSLEAFQYSTTEGFLPLREYIAKRYREHHGLDVQAKHILITNGSQQGLDLIGKVLLNKGDHILLERPAYLGAIQALSLYEPLFHEVNLLDDGLCTTELANQLEEHPIKLIYTVPNFQNPTGLTYSLANRQAISRLLCDKDVFLIEDDPYGELRFKGENLPYIKAFGPHKGILLGSFSKIITPGMRLGWICTTNDEMMDKLIIAKQASDLHTNVFSQKVIYEYLVHNNLEEHISHIKALYKEQSTAMVEAIAEYFPKDIKVTVPEGGMFLWVTLPETMSSLALFDLAAKEHVAFVPGEPFYAGTAAGNTFRLNYTSSDKESIREGIKRLGAVIKASY